MARFKGQDLYVNDDDQIYFGDNQEAALWYKEGELRLNHTISGSPAIEDYHLIQKGQVIDAVVSGISFLDLIDTPSFYPPVPSGTEVIVVKMNDTGDGLEFAPMAISEYAYDPSRDKWLTAARPVWTFGKEGPADDIYLGVAGVSTLAGYYIYHDAVITGVYCRAGGGGDVNKAFEIVTVSGVTETSVYPFAFGGIETLYVAHDLDIDVTSGTLMRVYVGDTGSKVEDVICQVEIAWRIPQP